MKYYLVALFDNNSYEYVENIQKDICKKYKFYKKSPSLHITVQIIDEPNITELDKIITDLIKPYKRFKVALSGAICFDPPYKSVNMKIENKGYIIRLARQINEKLKMHGFKVKENTDNLDLYVPLANSSYSIKNSANGEYSVTTENTKCDNLNQIAKIDRFELWKVVNSKKSTVIRAYPLKEY